MRFDSQDDEIRALVPIRGAMTWIGEMIVANPASVGAATAFGVAMTFFTANALFFQQHQHPSALFATRPELLRIVPEDKAARREVARVVETRPAAPSPSVPDFQPQPAEHVRLPVVQQIPVPVPRPDRFSAAPAPQPLQLAGNADETIASMQEMLSQLGYYDGAVDGLRGPQTAAAIDSYKSKLGLRGIDLTDGELAMSMRNNLGVTAAIPVPKPAEPVSMPAPAPAPRSDAADVAASVAQLIAGADARPVPVAVPVGLPGQIPSAEVVRVQAALRAFGNTDIVVDGVEGEQTTAAIREFQSLFRLPVTGEIDGILLDKMRAVGLIH